MTQFASPSSTVDANGVWTGNNETTSNLHLELDETIASTDGSTTEVTASLLNAEGDNFLEIHLGNDITDPGIGTGHILSVRVKKTGGSPTPKLNWQLYEGATLIAESGLTNITSTSYSTKTLTLTGTEADNISGQTGYDDLRVRLTTSGTSFSKSIEVSTVEFETPDATSDHPSPTSLELDRVSSPNNTASDNLLFSCIAETNGAETINKMQIQVDDVNTFTSPIWDAGFQAITNVTDGNRTDEVPYSGNTLSEHPVGDKYYVRIRLQDSAAVNSAWSSIAEFKVTKLGWDWDDANMRHVLHWVEDHPELPVGYVQKFQFQTGNREKVASNGHFNESVQASGGFQIAYFNNRTHVVYLGTGNDTDGKLTVWINSFDWITEVWGTPRFIGDVNTGSDSHFFPVIGIDGSGYLHIPYGAHDTLFRYTRSRLPNDAGTLPGDTSTKVFIKPSVLPTETEGFESITGFSGTYPIAFYEPTADRMYFFFRVGLNSGEYGFVYSDDEGETWSAKHTIIDDTVDPYRVYLYGLRYDEVNQRLHIGWTFSEGAPLNRSTGAWFAYSDYGDTDGSSMTTAGFNIFKWADGGHAGYTSDDGTKTEIDRVDGEALLTSTNAESLIFISTLELDKNNKPVVFWLHHPKGGAATIGSFIASATYSADLGSAGTWTRHDLSQDVDLQLRVGRSGIAVMTDRDGIMRMWYPVNAKTPTYFLPTADRDSTGVTRFPTTPTNDFSKIDDGIMGVDGDTTYLDLAATTGKVSFDHSKTIDATYSILDVEVHAVVKAISAAGSCTLYIDDATTEDTSASIALSTADDYTVVSNNWGATNPLTSLAWTTADIDGLEFGIKNDHASTVLRVTKIFMSAIYTSAGDDEMFATEIWELQSTDDGATWTVKKEVTRNSALGTPIMNHSHRLTNDTIEVIWCSGNDIFYQRDTPYGLILPTGQDIRLYYDGAEIDRLIDYPNLDKTTISFKIQAVIALDRRAGPAPYVLYFAAPNTTTNAKADPQLVYPEFFESFETYNRGTNMSGTGGWTVAAGTWKVVSSPGPDPSIDHGNKIYAGNNAVNQSVFASSAYSMSQNITANYGNAFIEGACWVENQARENTIEVEDGAAKKYGVKLEAGLDIGIGFIRTAIDGAWVDSGFRAKSGQYRDFAIQITPSGASTFMDGRIVAREEAAVLTDVDKITLGSTSEAFFDYIRVSKNPEVGTVQTIDPPTPRAQFAWHTTNSDIEDITFDAKYESAGAYNRTHAVEVRVGLQSTTAGPYTGTVTMRVSGGSTYDATNVLAQSDISFTNISTTMEFQTKKILLAALKVEGPVSVKLDFHTTNDPNEVGMTTLWDWVKVSDMGAAPTITLQTREVQGWFMDCTLQGSGTGSWIMDADISENALKAGREITLAWLGGLEFVRNAAIEWWEQIEFVRANAISWMVGMIYTRSNVISWAENFEYDRSNVISWLESWELKRSSAISWMLDKLSDRSNAISWIKGFEYSRANTIGWIKGFEYNRSNAISWMEGFEYNRSNVISWMENFEYVRSNVISWLAGLEYNRANAISWIANFEYNRSNAIAWLESWEFNRSNAISWMESLEYNRSNAIAWLDGLEYNRSNAIAWLDGLEYNRTDAISWMESFEYNRAQPIEWWKQIEFIRASGIEWWKQIEFIRASAIEWKQNFEYNRTNAINWMESWEFERANTISWMEDYEFNRANTIGWIKGFEYNRSNAISWMEGFEYNRSNVISWMESLEFDRTNAISWLESWELKRSLAISWMTDTLYNRSNVISWIKNLEYNRSNVISWMKQVPDFVRSSGIAWMLDKVSGKSVAVSWVSAYDFNRVIALGWVKNLEYNRSNVISWMAGIESIKVSGIEWMINQSYLRTVTMRWNVNLEFNRAITMAWMVDFEFFRTLGLSWRLGKEFNRASGIEWWAQSRFARSAAIEWLVNKQMDRTTSMDFILNISSDKSAGVEWMVGKSYSRNATIEWWKLREFIRAIVIGWEFENISNRNLTIDWGKGQLINRSSALEFGLSSLASRGISIEFLLDEISNRISPLEWSADIAEREMDRTLGIEWTKENIHSRSISLDFSLELVMSRVAAIDFLISHASNREVAMEWVGKLLDAIITEDYELLTPDIFDVDLLTPFISAANLLTPFVSNADLLTPDVTDRDLLTPDITDGNIEGV